jgi:hypothetical protein
MCANLQRKKEAVGDIFICSGFQHFLGKKFNTRENKVTQKSKDYSE